MGMMRFDVNAKGVLLIVIVLLSFAVGYCALISLAEHREYKIFSIDYWVLNPKEMSAIANFCKDDPGFIYSAADGPKPLVVQLTCFATTSDVTRHLEQNGFVKADAGNYKKDKKEIELTLDVEGKLTAATMLVFL